MLGGGQGAFTATAATRSLAHMERNVHYVLVAGAVLKRPQLACCPRPLTAPRAEFDIDKGSMLRFQYPAPTGIDNRRAPRPRPRPHRRSHASRDARTLSALAEMMLPEGVHSRETDFTVSVMPFSVRARTLTHGRIDLAQRLTPPLSPLPSQAFKDFEAPAGCAPFLSSPSGWRGPDSACSPAHARSDANGVLFCLSAVRTKMDSAARRWGHDARRR